MGDGAHLGMGAEGAMRGVLGGEEPEQMTDEEFDRMIRETPLDYPPTNPSYDGAANLTARLILEAYEQYPMLRDVSDEGVYLRDRNGEINWEAGTLNVTLYQVIKRLYPDYGELFGDLTGFMWGWAMNAARKVLGWGPVPNPAIMTISIPKSSP